MTWVKLEEAVRLDMRAKIAVITKQDFVNLTERPVSEFIAIVRRDTRVEDTEEVVREVLEKMYPEAENWTITQIGFSLSRQALEVVVEHPSFAKVHPAYELPRLSLPVFAGDEIYPNVFAIESPASDNSVVVHLGDGRVGVAL